MFDGPFSFGRLELSHGGSLPGYRAGFDQYIAEDVTIITLSNFDGEWNVPQFHREVASVIFHERFWLWHQLN